MILSIDIGNTHTDLGWGDGERILRRSQAETASWEGAAMRAELKRFVGRRKVLAVAVASVVPRVVPQVRALVAEAFALDPILLRHRNVVGIGIDYPKPTSIGADRLANAMAATRRYGAPVVVVDFGTAVTFDVVDARPCYVGGIIAPGLGAMTDYLHEKTALLPRVRVREVNSTIGKNTREAMLIGTVKGYRGLIKHLLSDLRKDLAIRRLRVVATGGYASLMAKDLPEIKSVNPDLTLEGLQLLGASQCDRLDSE